MSDYMSKGMRIAILGVSVLCSQQVKAQLLPDMPVPHAKLGLGEGIVEQHPTSWARFGATVRKPEVLAGIQAGAALFDGLTTARAVRMGYVEGDPLTRPLIGMRPTMGRMALAGAAEVGVAYLLARKWPKMRWVQVGAIGAHLGAGSWNLRQEAGCVGGKGLVCQ